MDSLLLLQFLFAVLVSFPGICASQSWKEIIPEDATRIGNHFLKYYHEPGVTWEEADEASRRMGGRLVIPRENIDISLATGLPAEAYFWVGLLRYDHRTVSLYGGRSYGIPIRYNSRTGGNCYIFFGPVVNEERSAGAYLIGYDTFPVDGYICEWSVTSENELFQPPPTIDLFTTAETKKTLDELGKKLESNLETGSATQTFHSADGKSLNGVFRSLKGDVVHLRDRDFTNLSIPLSRFSEADQSHFKSLAADGATEPEIEVALVGLLNEFDVEAYKKTNPFFRAETPDTPVYHGRVEIVLFNAGSSETGNLIVVHKVDFGKTESMDFQYQIVKSIPSKEKSKVWVSPRISQNLNPSAGRGFRLTIPFDKFPVSCTVAVYSGSREIFSMKRAFQITTTPVSIK
ncbi:MAG: hypothetical protein AAGC68_02660 [Verrucomicrobiota bacterium]